MAAKISILEDKSYTYAFCDSFVLQTVFVGLIFELDHHYVWLLYGSYYACV